MTKGKLTAIDIIKPIFIISLDRHCEKLVRMFPANNIINYFLFITLQLIYIIYIILCYLI